MLRYLDNNQNKKSSPNQNFARELMELFLLGVGNYTEADVEAERRGVDGPLRPVGRRGRPVPLAADVARHLGQVVPRRRRSTAATDPKLHGPETIDVMLGDGTGSCRGDAMSPTVDARPARWRPSS